ncbi:DUF2326 domain-containing protein [Listeria booriae]|uniref:DUF2326 domain-containing protein n=1 Tax=Listeria booriae TaxID=1552123 RepID=UPI0016236CC1|nr:DUF2326 domain-containing protein [Listeria booriae]MBC2056237.1 DUF2326 domain-containing protein [Listeria booriae]
MFLKSLVISSNEEVIRDIPFHIGANLIIDETVGLSDTDTGNNVGKTTVLKLIDFCLGGKADIIYKDTETKKVFQNVKSFLEDNNVIIELTLVDNLLELEPKKLVIRRNFLVRNKKIMEINGENLTGNKGEDFFNRLDTILLGDRVSKKPTLKQVIAHNIRYSDIRINNTLRMVNGYTSLPEYEALFLFMFGIEIPDRSTDLKKLKFEKEFLSRLTKEQGINELELQLSKINDNLLQLDTRKRSLNINENYEVELARINVIKYEISKVGSEISELTLRKELILETEQELKTDISKVDMSALREVYSQATSLVIGIQKTFEELVNYHNNMILEKIRFIIQDVPKIDGELLRLNQNLNILLAEEKEIKDKLICSDTFKDLEIIIQELNTNYQRKGELEKNISQVKEVEKNIAKLDEDIGSVDEEIFSEEFKKRIYNQIEKFNRYFSQVSNELYGEDYGITFETSTDKKTGKPVYTFNSFNDNNSSGKKQGEIICFDLAYILFARAESIPSVDFILNDKKELMYGSQLVKLSEFAKRFKIQLVFSILKDKLPPELDQKENIILRLSQDEKLFKIENNW